MGFVSNTLELNLNWSLFCSFLLMFLPVLVILLVTVSIYEIRGLETEERFFSRSKLYTLFLSIRRP